jgi:hypothetical protein
MAWAALAEEIEECILDLADLKSAVIILAFSG